MLDWTLLRTFHTVAGTGSLSAAARQLRLSQPTVSRQIAALEKELGTRLFLRRARGLTLTPAAESIREAASRMDELAATVTRRAASAEAGFSGTIRLSTTEGLGVLWLLPRLHEFRRTHPGLAIELAVDNAAVDLAKREADIALRLFRPTEGDLVARKVGQLGFGFYASTDYLARKGRPKSAADLARHDIVGIDRASPGYPQARYLQSIGLPPEAALRTNSLIGQIQAAKSGLGIAAIGHYAAADDPQLVQVLAETPFPPIDLWLVVHSDMRSSPRVRAMSDYLAQLVRRDRRRLEGGVAT
jgi:DNA-binding transcriptional LysR family regulator